MDTAPPQDDFSVKDDLASLRHEPEAHQPGPRCAVERLKTYLAREVDGETARVVWGACDDPHIAPATLTSYLKEKFPQVQVSPYTLRRHRRRFIASADSCRCPR